MNVKIIILRNFPNNDFYDKLSFIGMLHEEKIWDMEEYWLLEWRIYNLKKNSSEKLDWEVFRIYSFIMLSLSSHLDKNDSFKIRSLELALIYEFRERIQLVFEGYFSQIMPRQSIFEKTNPLLAFTST
ncbi:hypothetical protein ACG9ZL_14295 [Acinetobacter sp. ULE_I057]|uniref:hypothetical protein n=1 Tax=Acinetobacter sp. ULE_I057 TaxID=3373070 RepID=UPI003AF61C70